jgi:hypothetical protein
VAPTISTMRSPVWIGRGAGERRDDRDPPVAHVDLYPDAAVRPGRALHQPAQPIGGEERRVRVLELPDHPVDGLVVELRLAQRVHVIARHVREHVVEQTRALVDAPALGPEPTLDQPPAGDEGRAERRHHHDCT